MIYQWDCSCGMNGRVKTGLHVPLAVVSELLVAEIAHNCLGPVTLTLPDPKANREAFLRFSGTRESSILALAGPTPKRKEPLGNGSSPG